MPAKSANGPTVVVIGGPNGAGKSTIAPRVLRGVMGVTEFVNADVIARGLSAFNPAAAAMEAGRIMLTRIRVLAEQRQNFAFETTLASRSFAPWIAGLREQGYMFRLVFLWLPTPEMAIGRVALRVSEGGHHVPNETIRRRHAGGMRNLFELYLPLADAWRCYDGSIAGKPEIIASGRGIDYVRTYDKAKWQNLQSVGTTIRPDTQH
jgi:predicted ABC-type ATPase